MFQYNGVTQFIWSGTIARVAHQAVTTQDEARKFGEKLKKISDLEELGSVISTFITVSRGEEMSSSNRDTWCRAFTEGVKHIKWAQFSGESGKL